VSQPLSPAAKFLSRLVAAAIVIAVFAAVVQADVSNLAGAQPAWWLVPIAVLAAARGSAEAAALFAARGIEVRRGLVQLAAAGIALAPAVAPAVVATGPWGPLGLAAFATTTAVGLIIAAELPGYRAGEHRLDRVTAGVGTAVALGLPIAFMVALRLLGEREPHATVSPLGRVLPLVSLVAVVKGGDIAAYVVGSLVGRRRMTPALSPGKTWEGAIASLAASVAVAWLVIDWLPRAWLGAAGGMPWGGWPVYGLVVGTAGMVGDLAESFVKRELGTKDSGRLLGGLGGVLDLVDALLVAAPVAWLLWALG
jgi:phosphatidate cytidylyltransferase